MCSIVRYCFRSFKQLLKDPLHVLTDANVLVLIDTDQSIFVNGRFSLPSCDIETEWDEGQRQRDDQTC